MLPMSNTTFFIKNKNGPKSKIHLIQNLDYSELENFFVCPMGQKLEYAGEGTRISKNGLISQVDYYEAKRCEGYPLRGMCRKSIGNKK